MKNKGELLVRGKRVKKLNTKEGGDFIPLQIIPIRYLKDLQ